MNLDSGELFGTSLNHPKMLALLTLIAAATSYVITVTIVIGKLGLGEGALGWTLLAAVPFAILAALSIGFRKRRKEGWIVLCGTFLCAVLGFHGIYEGFFSPHPHDPRIVIFRPLAQIGLVIVVGLVSGVTCLLSRKSRQRKMEPKTTRANA